VYVSDGRMVQSAGRQQCSVEKEQTRAQKAIKSIAVKKSQARRGEHAAAAIVKILAKQMQVHTDKSMQAVGWLCKQDMNDVMEMEWVCSPQSCAMCYNLLRWGFCQ